MFRYMGEEACWKHFYHLARLGANFDCHCELFGRPDVTAPGLISRVLQFGIENKEHFKSNILVRALWLHNESTCCQDLANLLQLNSDERDQLADLRDESDRAKRVYNMKQEVVFAEKLERLVSLLDKVYLRTTRARKYAISVQEEAESGVRKYQKVHGDRVEAFRTGDAALPGWWEFSPLNKKKLKKARDYWEKDARRGRWHGLGLEDKFEGIEIGVRSRRRKVGWVVDHGC